MHRSVLSSEKVFFATVVIGATIAAAVCIGIPSYLTSRGVPKSSTKLSVLYVTTPSGRGSAVPIGNGYFLTAEHVVESETTIKLSLGQPEGVDAVVTWVSKVHDIALLKVAKGFERGFPIRCSETRLGEEVEAIGYPYGLARHHMYGRIAGAPDHEENGATNIVMDIPVIFGMSGGAVLDGDRSLVGVIRAVRTVPSLARVGHFVPVRMGYAVPMSAICPMIGRK